VDREVDRVARAGAELVGSDRRLDVPATVAGVLLPEVSLAHEAQRDDVDLLVLLVLAFHLLETSAALGARLVCLVELVLHVDDRPLRLLLGAVAALLLLLVLALVVALGARAGLLFVGALL